MKAQNSGLKIAASRRAFVKGVGGLLIGFSFTDSGVLPKLFAAPFAAPDPQSPAGAAPATQMADTGFPSPARLDSWIRIDNAGKVKVFADKVDIGTGIETAL